MAGTAQLQGSWKPISDHNPIPARYGRMLAANEKVGRGQFVTVAVATGYAALNDGTVPGLLCAGVGEREEISNSSTTAGLAEVVLAQRMGSGLPASTIANDGFTDADFGVPFFIANENTPGKLSHYTSSQRSLGGLVFGVDHEENDTPILWPGPLAALIARGVLIANSFCIAHRSTALLLKTAIGEMIMERHGAVHGTITGVKVATPAGLSGNATDYWTITVSKRTAAAPGTAVTIATGTTAPTTGIGEATSGDLTAYKEYALGLTATTADLVINETDVLTVAFTTNGSTGGPANAQMAVNVTAKVG
jgi:hypothetical protein